MTATLSQTIHWAPWAVLLYPKGLVSPRQAQQLACWGRTSFAGLGTFDDCQRMVKEAFHDPAIRETHVLSSANSISLGRLLSQMVYCAQASRTHVIVLSVRPGGGVSAAPV